MMRLCLIVFLCLVAQNHIMAQNRNRMRQDPDELTYLGWNTVEWLVYWGRFSLHQTPESWGFKAGSF